MPELLIRQYLRAVPGGIFLDYNIFFRSYEIKYQGFLVFTKKYGYDHKEINFIKYRERKK